MDKTECDAEIERLRRGIARDKREIIATIQMIGEDNHLIPGILNNLGVLQERVTKLQTLLSVQEDQHERKG